LVENAIVAYFPNWNRGMFYSGKHINNFEITWLRKREQKDYALIAVNSFIIKYTEAG